MAITPAHHKANWARAKGGQTTKGRAEGAQGLVQIKLQARPKAITPPPMVPRGLRGERDQDQVPSEQKWGEGGGKGKEGR